MLLAKTAFTAAATALYGARYAGALQYKVPNSSTWTPSNFFDGFEVYTGPDPDPLNGYVSYVDQATAQSLGLIDTSGGAIYLGTEFKKPPSSSGVSSVRLSSKQTYNKGLFVVSLDHIPSAKGAFAKFGTSGSGYPANGVIDIISGKNLQTGNQMTVRTSPNCSMVVGGTQVVPGAAGSGLQDCGKPTGCGTGPIDAPYGSALPASGGVYAMEWTGSVIQIWYFKLGSPQADQLTTASMAGTLNTSSFGTALFSVTSAGGRDCKIQDHFKGHHITIAVDFCGAWAGGDFSGDGTCEDYASSHFGDFKDAYWGINAVRYFSATGQ